MFDSISGRYDLLNHLLSGGIDRRWRRKAIRLLRSARPQYILDVATGTGDLAVEALRLNPVHVTGVDLSEGMLAQGRNKIGRLGLADKIDLIQGDSENLPFGSNKFDAVTVGFGVRNFEDLGLGLREIHRVLKPGGIVVILEFSKPRWFPFNKIYDFYFRAILPKIGRWISGDNAAYSYLPASVQAFPDGEAFVDRLRETGFRETKWMSLTFGISSIYTARK